MKQGLEYMATSEISAPSPYRKPEELPEDYAPILKEYNLTFEKAGVYYKVGDSDHKIGWILDISVIAIQFKKLLAAVLPILIKNRVPFKIARNSQKVEFLLNGKLGYLQLGKIISIYPGNEGVAFAIAETLIQVTKAFRGPEILTDRHLGNVVYTRYGAYNPIVRINQSGIEEQVIDAPNGDILRDIVSIPFHLPKGVGWPFGTIVRAKLPRHSAVLQDRYLPMYILKDDFKGAVRKGLYL